MTAINYRIADGTHVNEELQKAGGTWNTALSDSSVRATLATQSCDFVSAAKTIWEMNSCMGTTPSAVYESFSAAVASHEHCHEKYDSNVGTSGLPTARWNITQLVRTNLTDLNTDASFYANNAYSAYTAADTTHQLTKGGFSFWGVFFEVGADGLWQFPADSEVTATCPY